MSGSEFGLKPAPTSTADERCDLCRAPLAETHQHLLDPVSRKLECACDACAILFSGDSQRYRRIPRRVRFLPEFRMTDAQWDGLRIPIGLAFFVRHSDTGRIAALYPSPAGPVESQLTLETWEEITRESPELRTMESDVEGLLAYRIGTAREHYIIPLDDCFKLIGIIRMRWKGFSGGLAVWQDIGQFLESLRQRSPK